MTYDKLRFGTAGSPFSTIGKGRSAGVAESIRLGFGCQELEFVHGVNMNEEDAKKIHELIKKHNFIVTAHGPYYINLNAVEHEKIAASKKRVMDTARALQTAGGTSMTFHPAFYLKQEPEKVYDTVKKRLKEITTTLRDEGNTITISPETTGKPTQFGHYKELIRLAQDIEGIGICVDFAHLHARSNGKYNTKEEFMQVLTDIEQGLGKEALHNMHIHVSGINYGEKGEKNHLPLLESDLQWQELVHTWKAFKIRGSVIVESPILEKDALIIKKAYEAL